MGNANIKEIKIMYDDETETVINKGFFCEFGSVGKEGEKELIFKMVGISGKDLTEIVY